jgi:hypothetical protein
VEVIVLLINAQFVGVELNKKCRILHSFALNIIGMFLAVPAL